MKKILWVFFIVFVVLCTNLSLWDNPWWEWWEWWEWTQSSDYWMTINTDCLLNWQCKMNVYKLIWIRTSDPNPTVLWFFQDITLASTTVFLWTVLVIAMIIGWLSRSFASITWKDTKKWKEILIASFVWMLLVMWSYAIIRLIQFLALAGS